MKNYEITPSFYVSEEYFKKYLGQTSYYLKLQDVTEKIIRLTHAEKVLELGSALGTTVGKFAAEFRTVHFTGVDIREDVVEQAEKTFSGLDNLEFKAADMCDYVKDSLSDTDLIYLLYSFHHIDDPLERKEEFLKTCHRNMKKGSFLFIVESFLPGPDSSAEDINRLYEKRALEGYASTYWNSLNSIDEEGLALSKKVASVSFSEESKAGEMVVKRDTEYLVDFDWLVKACEDAGFEVVIAEPVNCICENAILLRRR